MLQASGLDAATVVECERFSGFDGGSAAQQARHQIPKPVLHGLQSVGDDEHPLSLMARRCCSDLLKLPLRGGVGQDDILDSDIEVFKAEE